MTPAYESLRVHSKYSCDSRVARTFTPKRWGKKSDKKQREKQGKCKRKYSGENASDLIFSDLCMKTDLFVFIFLFNRLVSV